MTCAAFVANDGDSYRRKATIISYEEFLTELEWPSDGGDLNAKTKAEKLADPARGIANPDGLYGQCGYLQRKYTFAAEDRSANWYPFNNFIITRYADVLLMYAEACAQAGTMAPIGRTSGSTDPCRAPVRYPYA